MSRSSKRNKKRRERSKIRKRFSKGNPKEGESKTVTRDARTYLDNKRQKMSESVQSLVDKKGEERKMTRLTRSSHPANTIIIPRDAFSQGGTPEAPMLINSPLAAGILATLDPAKIKVKNMAAFDGTSCPEEHIMAYKNLMLLYTTNRALLCKIFPTTLTGVALTWYTSLPVESINIFA